MKTNRGFLTFTLAMIVFAAGFSTRVMASDAGVETFEWFSTLGFPDVQGRPFVHVQTGYARKAGDELLFKRTIKGFLLEELAPTFSIFGLNLMSGRLTNSPPGTASHEIIGFVRRDLQNECAETLERLARSKQGNEDSDPSWITLGLSQPSKLIVLAWGCWRNGLSAEAESLFSASRTLWESKQMPPGADFRRALEDDIAHCLVWRGILDFSETSISRKELLTNFIRIEKCFPRTPHRELVKEIRMKLARMVTEDSQHAAVRLEDLPRAKQIDELIFQMRDQNGRQWSQPGSCDIFLTADHSTNTPAHRLVALGKAAAPALIEAFTDQTLSRSVEFHRNFYFSHRVLTVGDCAAEVISRISGKQFSADDQTKARFWWKNVANRKPKSDPDR